MLACGIRNPFRRAYGQLYLDFMSKEETKTIFGGSLPEQYLVSNPGNWPGFCRIDFNSKDLGKQDQLIYLLFIQRLGLTMFPMLALNS